jgi:hypothetical protein
VSLQVISVFWLCSFNVSLDCVADGHAQVRAAAPSKPNILIDGSVNY